MQTSGFFNAQKVNGLYDREYNADHYSDNLAVIISDGVLRSKNDDLKPTADGMTINIGVGRAWIRGKWYKNDTVYKFSIPTPPTTNPRIDRVVLRYDNTRAVRSITLQYLTGTPAETPVPPAVEDNETIKDLVICEFPVGVNATSVVVKDTRADKTVCGWVYSVKGDDEFFETLDNDFHEWFDLKKDTLASVTIFKKYMYRTLTETAGQTRVAFNIPQYDPTGVDLIEVYFNGRLQIEGVDYTLDNSVIIFTSEKSANQEVVVFCTKSIDGTGLGSVVDMVTELQNKVATLGDLSDYNYICNGVDDNVKISEIVSAFLAGSTSDNAMLSLNIIGSFGASAPAGGAGTTDDPYQWIKAGDAVYTNRKVILDFSNCSVINITCPNNTKNVLFYGYNAHIKNVRMNATEAGTTGSIIGFSGSGGKAVMERCLIHITAGRESYIAQKGEFENCRFSVKCTNGNAYVFNAISFSFIKVYGGEFYAYCVSGFLATVFYVPANGTNAVIIANAVSCPTSASGSYLQGYAVQDLSANGKCAYNNFVTTLPINATSQKVSNTLAVSKVDYV